MSKQVDAAVIIPISKRKIIIGFVVCILFIALGIFLTIAKLPQTDLSRPRHHPLEIRITGIANIAIFSFFLIMGIKGLHNRGAGLIVNRKGITFAMTQSSTEFIKWSHIERITITKVRSQTFLTLHLRNPEKYLRSGTLLQRIVKRINMKFWGSPIHVSSLGLQIRFSDLIALIEQYHPVEGGAAFTKRQSFFARITGKLR